MPLQSRTKCFFEWIHDVSKINLTRFSVFVMGGGVNDDIFVNILADANFTQ